MAAAAENSALAVREPSADRHARLITAVQNGDKKAEAELLDKNSGLIWSIVRRFAPRAAPRGIETDDLYQLGSIGFIKAVRNFDLSKGTALSTYAVPKIIGEIRRFLRDDGLIKISRSAKEAANKLTAARDKFIYTNGSEPTLAELSAITGIPPEDIAAADEALTAFDSLLSGGPADDERGIEDIGSDEAMECGIVEKIALSEAIALLDPKEKAVISLRYRRSFTQQKTAELLGISQVQVSRIETRTLARLRQIMEEKQ